MNLRRLTATDWVRGPIADSDDEAPLAEANAALRRAAIAELDEWWPDSGAVLDPDSGDRTVSTTLSTHPARLHEWFGDVDEVIGIASPPYLSALVSPDQHVGDPSALPESMFSTPTDPSAGAPVRCEPLTASQLLAGGAVLRVMKADHLSERIGDLAVVFERAACSLTNIHFYISSGETSGSGLHRDTMDVIAFQLEGRKHWSVHSDGETPTALPVIDTELAPGDAVVLPQGHWHLPTPVGETSVHVSVAFARPTTEQATALLAERGQHAVVGDGRHDALRATCFDVGARLVPRRAPALLRLRDMAANPDVTADRWRSAIRTGIGVVDSSTHDGISLAANGWVVEVESALVPLIARLCAPNPLSGQDVDVMSPAPRDVTRQIVATLGLVGLCRPEWEQR